MHIDIILRVLFYILTGTILLIANVWFIRLVQGSLFSRDVVIVPFQVSGSDPDDGKLGRNLAEMLQARLDQLQRQLAASQRVLIAGPKTGVGAASGQQREEDPQTSFSLLSPVKIPTAVFEPVNINVKVGGVEVGGVFAWLQRTVVKPKTLTFTVYIERRRARGPGDDRGDGQETHAIITGNLDAFTSFRAKGLWVEAQGTPDEIVTTTAHALIQQRLSEDGFHEVEALELDEFRSLLASLFKLADLNQKVSSGRSVGAKFDELSAALEPLTQKVPEWYELKYLTASVAENAGRQDVALQHYEQLQDQLRRLADVSAATRRTVRDKLRVSVDEKIRDLKSHTSLTGLSLEQRFIDQAAAYAKRLNLPPPEPTIVFTQKETGTLAFWNSDKKRYEVEAKSATYPGLDRYVALMGRFMAKHYDRCFGQGERAKRSVDLWQELRSSLVEYVISTDPDSPGPSDQRAYGMPLFKALKRMGGEVASASEDVKAVRKLVLTLLDRYECDWTRANLLSNVLVVNRELGQVLSEEVIKQTFTAEKV